MLAGLGLSLSGCIAAAAIPVLAGGGLLGSRIADDRNARPEPTIIGPPPFERVSAAPADITNNAAQPLTARPASSAQDELDPISATQQLPSQSAEPVLLSGTPAPIQLTLPDGSRVAVSGATATGKASGNASSLQPISEPSFGRYESLLAYTLGRVGPAGVIERRRSAILADPGALDPATAPCSVSQPAMVIDIDPDDSPLDTAASYAANPNLALVLQKLREAGVTVHWLSGNSAAEAGAIRRLLTQSGLDPESRDELVLMRYSDDRKQTRREAVGATHCLIAIAGEDRRDFDELYSYLKNASSASGLQPLYGNGWFLIPPALQPQNE